MQKVHTPPGIYADKQVSTHSIQFAGESMGITAWNTFVPRVERPYIVRRSEKPRWTYLPCWENCMLQIVAANLSALAWQTTLENCTKALNKEWNQTILLSITSSDCWVHVLRSPPRPFWIQKQRKLLNVVALQNYSSLGPWDHTAHEKIRTAWEQGNDSGVLRSDRRQAASAQNWIAILTHCLF